MPRFVEVTTGRKAPRSRRGLLFHESKTLDVIRRHGLPVTTPARTLLDVAATRPYAELERACSEALVLGLVSAEALTAQSGAGSAALKRLAADGVAPTRSGLERRFNWAMRKAGLPVPLANEDVLGEEVDFVWREHGLIVEVDGWRFHGHRIAFEPDRSRDAELQLGGYTVLRFTWRRMTAEPAGVAADIRRALSARARSAAGTGRPS